ncbi:phosphoesterase [Clostridium polyendosporum]|uniref:Phosphoesterase n=1 Tax=Clostridium polyendosporum TaxID=69208 RepID=A0A919VFS6_9CLOT|nr:metallophosphoesterase [Clostridium polyendosporum]GIM28725.1 phosphoesterase [Clostridium polyendosporum]
MKMLKAFFFVTLLIIFLYLQNNLLKITRIKLSFDKLPKSFNGYKIVHLSDLHGKTFGRSNNKLISTINKEKPDLIVITGDLVDVRYFNDNETINFLDQIKQIAPIYYVTGNHELAKGRFTQLEKILKKKGVKILRNSTDMIKKNTEVIALIGIDDPILTDVTDNNINRKLLSMKLEKLLKSTQQSTFKVLLSHRPEQFSLYAEYNIDLTFTGHAHGGQIRLPFTDGLIAPNQGFLPKYTSGKYTLNNSTMIVSRGLGNGSIPIRLFNRPEVIVTTLYRR